MFPASTPDPTLSRVVRVFISSTFRDFSTERDLLMKRVFPELRRRARDRFVEVIGVDLRWGITEEESQQGKTLPICLREIERSRPYFVCLLGERYGWTPAAGQYPELLLEQQPWLRGHAGGKSVTELEILHGVLNAPEMAGRAYFYFRDSAWSEGRDADYRSEGVDERAKLGRLKERIRSSEFPSVEYSTPEALADRITDDLWKLIDAEYPEDEVPDELERERRSHEAYAAERRRLYIGQEETVAALLARMEAASDEPGDEGSRTRTTLVTAESGTGKSALIANTLARYREAHPDHVVIEHYIGSTSEASDPLKVIRRVSEEIRRVMGASREVEDDPEQLVEHFVEWLAEASWWAGRRGVRLVLALDALDKLSERSDLRWLPKVTAPHVRIVVSSLEGDSAEAMRRRQPGELQARPFTPEVARNYIVETLARRGRRLPARELDRIVSHPRATLPIYLKTLVEELSVFGSHEGLPQRITECLAAQEPDDLFEVILARLEEDLGRDAVKKPLEAIWASSAGMSEESLIGFTGVRPLAIARLRASLDESMMLRHSRVDFAHAALRAAIEARYFTSRAMATRRHLALFEWHAQYCDSEESAGEVCYQLGQLPVAMRRRDSKLFERLWSQLLRHASFADLQMIVILKCGGMPDKRQSGAQVGDQVVDFCGYKFERAETEVVREGLRKSVCSLLKGAATRGEERRAAVRGLRLLRTFRKFGRPIAGALWAENQLRAVAERWSIDGDLIGSQQAWLALAPALPRAERIAVLEKGIAQLRQDRDVRRQGRDERASLALDREFHSARLEFLRTSRADRESGAYLNALRQWNEASRAGVGTLATVDSLVEHLRSLLDEAKQCDKDSESEHAGDGLRAEAMALLEASCTLSSTSEAGALLRKCKVDEASRLFVQGRLELTLEKLEAVAAAMGLEIACSRWIDGVGPSNRGQATHGNLDRFGAQVLVSLCTVKAKMYSDGLGERFGHEALETLQAVDRIKDVGGYPSLLAALIHDRRGNPVQAIKAYRRAMTFPCFFVPQSDWSLPARERLESLLVVNSSASWSPADVLERIAELAQQFGLPSCRTHAMNMFKYWCAEVERFERCWIETDGEAEFHVPGHVAGLISALELLGELHSPYDVLQLMKPIMQRFSLVLRTRSVPEVVEAVALLFEFRDAMHQMRCAVSKEHPQAMSAATARMSDARYWSRVLPSPHSLDARVASARAYAGYLMAEGSLQECVRVLRWERSQINAARNSAQCAEFADQIACHASELEWKEMAIREASRGLSRSLRGYRRSLVLGELTNVLYWEARQRELREQLIGS